MFSFPKQESIWLQSLLTLPLDGYVRSSRPGLFKAGKDPLYSLNRGGGRAQKRFGRFGEEKNILPLPGFEIRIVQPKTCSPY